MAPTQELHATRAGLCNAGDVAGRIPPWALGCTLVFVGAEDKKLDQLVVFPVARFVVQIQAL